MKILGLILALCLTGCSSTNLAEIVQAAGHDPATVCARVTSVYGTLTYLRANPTAGKVSCDTLTVEVPTAVAIPLAITPSFTVTPR